MSEYRDITSAGDTFVYTRLLDTANCSHEVDPNCTAIICKYCGKALTIQKDFIWVMPQMDTTYGRY